MPRRRIAGLLNKVDCACLLLVGLQRSRDGLPRSQLDGISKLECPCLTSAIGHSFSESLDAVCCAVLGGRDAARSEEDVEGESVGGSCRGNRHCEECLYIINLIHKIFNDWILCSTYTNDGELHRERISGWLAGPVEDVERTALLSCNSM